MKVHRVAHGHRMAVGLAPWCGTSTGYAWHLCRCAACTSASVEKFSAWRIRRYAERVEVDGRMVHHDAPHGRWTAYTNWGCRCALCTRAKKRSDLKNKRPSLPKPVSHGSLYRYRRGCRCEPCTKANSDQTREQRARRYAERVEVNGRMVHPRARHGSGKTAYDYFGCRCQPCTSANRKKGT